ncbi:MAG: MFS transporter [Microthrixaceae bacterium]
MSTWWACSGSRLLGAGGTRLVGRFPDRLPGHRRHGRSRDGPSSLAVINQMFAREDRSKALGFWSLVMAGGPVLGLVLGGPLVEAVGWRAIFWFQTPLLLAAAVAAFFLLPETRRHRNVHFDVLGQVALVVSLGACCSPSTGPRCGARATRGCSVGSGVPAVAVVVRAHRAASSTR